MRCCGEISIDINDARSATHLTDGVNPLAILRRKEQPQIFAGQMLIASNALSRPPAALPAAATAAAAAIIRSVSTLLRQYMFPQESPN